jgi:glutamine cyclotransferase
MGILGAGCAGNGSSTDAKPESIKSNRELKQKSKRKITIISPVNNDMFAPGEKIEFKYRLNEAEEIIDSVIYYVRGRKIGVSYRGNTGYSWVSGGIIVGRNSFNIRFYFNDGTSENRSLILRFKSDIVPDNYGFRIKNVFPHDPGAYTQGLAYHDGWLYEGTGKRGRSSLRKIKLSTGEIIGTLSLASELFGEGVCIFNDKIIQLTWTSRVGFVYDLASFKFIKKINYPTQGWGLTTDGKQLIMSDGSEKIYFLEPDYFTEQARIEVYDHDGPVINLNELEYINGEIWANVYQTDKIVRIDPETGKVLAWINLGGLLPQKDYSRETEVLNGIAYDEINKRLFVTGKMWPKLFHIELVSLQR